jgi:RNA polymerase sigma-70 factor, ECF subfamily
LGHLNAAYNLARWLTRDDHDAEDVVQEAYTRAYHRFSTFKGGNGRAWLLTIVRNCSYDFLKRSGTRSQDTPFDEEVHTLTASNACDPEAALLREERGEFVRNALMNLPPEHREVLILREMEELSYSEIASTMGVPLGTVMSRLSRARDGLKLNLAPRVESERIYAGQTSSLDDPKGVN